MPHHLELVDEAGLLLEGRDLLRRQVLPALDLHLDRVELEDGLARVLSGLLSGLLLRLRQVAGGAKEGWRRGRLAQTDGSNRSAHLR